MQHTTAQPPIEAFMPAKVYTEESAVDVATLNDCIEKIDLPGAIAVYDALVTQKAEIPADVKQSLLELVTFYNGTDAPAKELFEERDYASSVSRTRDYEPPQWKNGGFADHLFASIEPKTTAAYNTMIRGLLKFNQAQKANALFEEVIAKDVPIDTDTYNGIIESQARMFVIFEQRWAALEKLLQHMNEHQVRPNVHTMNALLEVVRTGGAYAVQRQKALNVLAEFKALNIEPSLGTWHIVLRIFCKEHAPVSHILVDILNHLGDNELKCHHQIDNSFFTTAMAVCQSHLKDFELAKRVDRLLNIGQNHKLIGDSYTQRVYYRNYLLLALKSSPLPEFITLYDDLVPNVQSLEIQLCENIIGKINETGAIENIPKFWSDMMVGDLLRHRNNKTIEHFLDVMCDNPPQSDVAAHADLNERFGECAWSYWQRLTFEVGTEHVTSLSASTLGKLLLLCCRHKQFDRASEILDATVVGTRKTIVTGAVPFEPLKAFIELCIEKKEPTLALTALEYAVESSLDESDKLGKIIVDNFTLNEQDARKVNNLVGTNVRTEKQQRL